MVENYVGTGLAGLPLTYTLENDTDYDRVEVVGVHAGFPDGFNSIDEADLIEKAYFYLDGGRETIGFGQNNGGTIARRWNLTIPWVASLNAITAGSGNIQPGSCKLTYYTENGVYVEVYDTQINATTGQWLYSQGGVSFISASSINYTTGAITITFASNRRPAWGDVSKAQGQPIRMTYKFANPVKYPTQWTVTRKWASGRVRQAKAWIGQASGEGMFVSKRIQTHTVYSDTAGTQVMPASPLWPTPIDQLKEYTRVYLRVGIDDGTVNADLPTYTLHADTASALNSAVSNISSQVFDHNNNSYLSRSLSSSDEYSTFVMEDPANNSGKGWMRVYQRRSYHTVSPTSSSATFSSITRDFLSLTSYFYVPHNNRHFDMAARLGNDYQGYDPLDHTISVNLGTGNGTNRSFSTTAVNRHSVLGGIEDGPMRQGRVWIYVDGVPVAHDRRGDGVLRRITGNDIVNLNSTANNYGNVNYSTGVITVSIPGVDPAPASGKVVSCTYGTRALRIGTISGTGTISAYALPSTPNQYGVYVRVGSGSTPLFEAWDGAGTYGGATGYLTPMRADSVVELQLVASANLTTTATGNIGTNLHPGSVEFFVAASTDGSASTFFCRDNGNGGLVGRNVSTGTIDYATGAFSITFSTTPTAGHNLYSNYRRNTSALPISGSVTYATGEVTVTVSSSVPANTPVFVTYVRNENSLKTIDPNAYPLGNTGFSRWLILFNSTYLDMECEAGPSYGVFRGPAYITLVGTNYQRDNITSSSNPEYMHDGANLSRLFRCYAKNNAVTADDNIWAARKVAPLQTIPTIDCYNATMAFGLHEGLISNITPEQNSTPFGVTQRAFTEDIGRKKSSAAIIFPFPYSYNQDGVPVANLGVNTSIYSNKSHYTALESWNNGDVYSNSVWRGKSPRNDFGWLENWYNGVNAGGAGRVGQDFSALAYQSQAWQSVRYLYHASLFPLVRPGAMLWNIALRSKWEDRAYRNYIGTGPSSGMVTNITGGSSVSAYGQPFGVDYLGRAHKACWSHGKVAVTNGSTSITFSTTQDVAGRWSWYGYTQSYTVTGTSRQDGLRRIAIQGSTKTYTLTNVAYNSDISKWVGTLDSSFVGATNTAATFGMFNDVRPGLDSPFIRTNPTLAAQARLGCGIFSLQHSIEGDSSSHQAAFTAFDVWCITGSWEVWDVTRHHAEWNMASCKQYNNWSFQQDQMRTSAWHLRSVVTGYAVTEALTGRPGFEFLSDSLYGGAADRYKEWIKIRLSQWVDLGAKGEMDPAGKITAGGRSPIVDLRVSSSSDKADWNNCAQMGSTSPQYGGTGSLTEAQKLFSASGFHYVSIWEISYGAPWAFAAYRLFKNDTTLVDLPTRGQTNVTLGEIVTRVFDAYSKFFVDYAFIDRLQNVPQRGAPGFYTTALANTPGYYGWGPVHGGNNTYWSLPTQWLAYPVDSGGTLRWGSIKPQYTNKTMTFPAETRDDDYVAVQIYWLRGSSFEHDASVSEPIDRLGHPLNNSGWLSQGFSSDTNTTFDLQTGPNDSAWHYPGIPFPGNALINGGADNNTSLELYNGTRAPIYPEAFNCVGISHDHASPLSSISFLFLSQVARFSSDPVIRARAGTIMNKYLTQALAMSLISDNYYWNPGITNYNKGLPVELNHYAGPISGAYPYATDSGIQPVDRWWDAGYRSRRRLSASPAHSDLTLGSSTFTINLSDYGIDDKSLMDTTEDVRVVLQYADGSYVLCESVVRQNASGDFLMFVKMPIDLPNGQGVSEQSTTLAWYVYYTNISAGPAAWENVNSPQAPYSNDATTRILWNTNGNYATDASANNWSLTTVPGLDPDYADGPVGGAVEFGSATLDTAFSVAAASVAKTASSSYLGGTFTVEFNVYLSPVDVALDSSANYGIFSLADDSVFPMLSYVENSSGNLLFLSSLGSSGGGYAINGCLVPGQYRKVASGPNGSTTSFGFTLNHTNILPGSVRICLSNGANVIGTDDGQGAITGTGIAPGSTVDYATGAVDVEFSSAPANGSSIYAFYSTVASPNLLELGAWNHVRFDYNGSRFAVFLNGTQVGNVTASGQLQPLSASSGTAFNLGSLFSPSILWTARSNAKLAEFRVSSSSRGTPSWSAEPFLATLLTEETQVTSGSASASVSAFIASKKQKTGPVAATVSLAGLTTTAAGEGYIVTSQNVEVAAAAEAAIVATGFEAPVAADASLLVDGKTKSASVRATIAHPVVIEYRGTGTIATLGTVTASGAANISGFTSASSRADAAIVVLDKELPARCAASLVLSSDVESVAPASGNIVVTGRLQTPASGTLAVASLSTAKASALLATAPKGHSRPAHAAIAILDKTVTGPVDGLIAGIHESYVQATGTISHVRLLITRADGEIVVDAGGLAAAPCAASVVVEDQEATVQVFATVSTVPSVVAPGAASVAIIDRTRLTPVVADLLVENKSAPTPVVADIAGISIESPHSAVASISKGYSSAATGAAAISASAQSAAPANAAITTLGGTSSAPAQATLSLARSASVDAGGYLVNEYQREAPCKAFIKLEDTFMSVPVSVTVAVTRSQSTSVTSTVATTKTRNAVCRAFVVLPLNQGLNASGIDFTEGGFIND